MQSTSFIDFEWVRDPAKRFELLQPEGKAPQIIWKGADGLQTYRPLEEPGIVEMFAAMKTPERALDFVKEFGLFTDWGWKHEEQVNRLLSRAAMLREIAALSQRKGAKIAAENFELWQTVELHLSPTRRGATVRYKVRDLEGAIILRFLLNVAGGIALKTCRLCQSPFTAGRGHRRADSKFCSPECQIKFKSNSNKRHKRKE